MKRGKKILFVILLILILLIPILSDLFFTEKTVFEQAFVKSVIDGDTIEIDSGEKIRLIGINTPEKKQNCYEEAKDKMSELVLNKTILLEKDKENTDRYNRLLRYIYIKFNDENIFINEEMIKLGLANYYPYGENLKYGKKLEKAEEYAKKNQIGCLWKNYQYSPVSNCIKIKGFHYDAEGNDNENLNDEYIVFENSCNENIDMNGWTLSDNANKQYKFKNFIFQANFEFVFYTGSGVNNETAIFWQQKMPVWNNNGDTLYLRNEKGDLMLMEKY